MAMLAAEMQKLRPSLESRKPTAGCPMRSVAKVGYESLGPIAAGAFSTIIRAKCNRSGTHVAIKTFDIAKGEQEPTIGAAYERELSVLRLLAKTGPHPNVANLLAEHTDGTAFHFVVLELCSGGTLRRYLDVLRKAMPTCPAGRNACTRIHRDAQWRAHHRRVDG